MRPPFCPNPECFKKTSSGPYECDLTQKTSDKPRGIIDLQILNDFVTEVMLSRISYAPSALKYEIYQCRACATQVIIGHVEDHTGSIRKILGNNLK